MKFRNYTNWCYLPNDVDADESRAAVAALTEFEWAPYDDPETYADIH